MEGPSNILPYKRYHNINLVLLYGLLVFVSLLCITPFVIVFVNATRSDSQIVNNFTLIPGTSLIENWKVMDSRIHFLRSFLNSCIIAVSGTLLSCYFGSLCGYSLAKLKFKGSRIVFGLVLMTLIVPWQIGLIGFFDLMNKYGMLNTYWPMIIPAIGNCHMVFFTKQYIESALPEEMMDAARIEGANEVRIFHRLALPIASPAIFTMGILIFIGLWNNYLTPFIILISNERFTLPLTVGLINNFNEFHPGATYLLLSVSIGIAVVIYMSLSKYIYRALNEGSMKG